MEVGEQLLPSFTEGLAGDVLGEKGGPRHAALWLTAAQIEEWTAGHKLTPWTAFSSVLGFWLLHMISIRVINRRKTLKSARGLAEVQHASVLLLHALAAVGAGCYLLMYQDLDATCGSRVFCVDKLSSLLMDFHVAYLIYELIFYHNSSKLLRPQWTMTLLHHAIFVVGFLLTKLYPCRLSLELLPLYELAASAGIFDALRAVLNQFGAPAEYHFNNLVAMMGTFAARAVIGGILAVKTWTWIKAHDLWALELPEGQSVLSKPYGMFAIAGSVSLLLIYIKWLVEGAEVYNNLMAAIDRQRSRAAAATGSGRGRGSNGRDKKRAD